MQNAAKGRAAHRGSEHDSRQSCPRHWNPEQRAVCWATRVESPSVREGSGHRKASIATNPPSEWVTTAVPVLRIVDDELWSQAKARQLDMRRVTLNGDAKRSIRRAPRFLFSGLTKCAECGGGYAMYWRDRLACSGARDPAAPARTA